MPLVNKAKRRFNNLKRWSKIPIKTKRGKRSQNVYSNTASPSSTTRTRADASDRNANEKILNQMGRGLRRIRGHVITIYHLSRNIFFRVFTTVLTCISLSLPVVRSEHKEAKDEGDIINQNTTTDYKNDMNSTIFANKTNICNYSLIAEYNGYNVSCLGYASRFWLTFNPPSKMVFYILGMLYIFISTVGLIGNFIVILMFIRCKSLRTPANMLVLNLAICDFLMLSKCPIAIYNNFMEGPALGDQACRMYGLVGGLSGTAAIGTLTAISIDRYKVVVHPLNNIHETSILRPNIIIGCIWLYSIGFSIMPALDIGLSVYVPEGYMTTCSFDYLDKTLKARIFMFTFFVAAWLIPFITIIFCYFHILKVVFASKYIQSNRKNKKVEHKLTIIILTIIALWFCAWTPYTVVALMGIFGYEQNLTPLASMIPALFCKVAACIDPYLYAATHPRFRNEVQRFLKGETPLRRESTIHSSFISRSTTSRRQTEYERRKRSGEAFIHVLTMVPEALDEEQEEGSDDAVREMAVDLSIVIEQSRF